MAEAFAYRLERRYGVAAETIRNHVLPVLGGEKHFQGGEELLLEGASVGHCLIILEGFAAQYKLLRSGKRQITGISVAGDIADLGTLFWSRSDHGVSALGPVIARSITHEQLRHLTAMFPDVRMALCHQLVEEIMLHRERIVSMGRRTAVEHFATLICELHWRLSCVDRARSSGFFLPLTQTDIADAMGMSTVHVNRVVKQLRIAGILRISGQQVLIENLDRLCEIAGFRNHALSALFSTSDAFTVPR